MYSGLYVIFYSPFLLPTTSSLSSSHVPFFPQAGVFWIVVHVVCVCACVSMASVVEYGFAKCFPLHLPTLSLLK